MPDALGQVSGLNWTEAPDGAVEFLGDIKIRAPTRTQREAVAKGGGELQAEAKSGTQEMCVSDVGIVGMDVRVCQQEVGIRLEITTSSRWP